MYGLTSEPQFLQTTLRSTSATPQKIARRRGRARPLGPALAFDRVSLALPGAHSAVRDVDDLLEPEAAEQARCDRAALAGGADHGHGPAGVDAVRNRFHVVIG